MTIHNKWIITGAAGFIGTHLAELLLSQGHQVIGLDNFSTGSSMNVARLTKKFGEKWQCLHVDICDAPTINTLFGHYRPDYVAHLAAQVSVPLSISQPQETQAINMDGFFNVIQAAKNHGVKRFIYASSSAVYGEQKSLPIKEIATLQPLSLYGLSKKINEEYAGLFATENFICIGLRLFNIFGSYQRADNPYSAVISKWLAQLKTANAITIYGDGSATRDYCYISNVTAAVQQLATVSLPHHHTIYNIGSGRVINLQELSRLLLNLTGRTMDLVQYAPWRAGDIMHSQADIQRAQQEFSYKVSKDLETGLREYLAYFS